VFAKPIKPQGTKSASSKQSTVYHGLRQWQKVASKIEEKSFMKNLENIFALLVVTLAPSASLSAIELKLLPGESHTLTMTPSEDIDIQVSCGAVGTLSNDPVTCWIHGVTTASRGRPGTQWSVSFDRNRWRSIDGRRYETADLFSDKTFENALAYAQRLQAQTGCQIRILDR
jgi:hypothetical protein